MQRRILMPLGAAAFVAVVLAGWQLALKPTPTADFGAETPLYPGLVGKLDDAARVEYFEAGKKVVVVKAPTGFWGVEAKSNYAADRDLVKTVLVGLAQAVAVEPRTDNPDLYARIGVEDPSAPDAKSKRLTVTDAKGGVLADLVVGKQDFHTVTTRDQNYYARRAGERRSWLIRTPLEVLQADPIKWIDRSLPKMERERVASIEIKGSGGGTVRLSRSKPTDEDFAVDGLPRDAKVKKTAVTEATGAVNLFSIDDLAKLDPAKFATGATQAVYRSFDGVVLTIRQVKEGDNRRLAFSATYDAAFAKLFAESKAPKSPPADAEAQVKDWNARYADWSYVVPDSMGDVFARDAADFVEKPARPGAAQPPAVEGEEAPPVPTDGN